MRSRNHIHMTSEGFSFHTFELKQVYSSDNKYRKIFDRLKAVSKDDEFYELTEYGEGRHFCGHLSKHGIRIYLSDLKDHFTIKLVINPRKLIDPDSSYLGIMLTDKKSLDKMEQRFTDLMCKIDLPAHINEWALTRIDLCVNFIFDRKKLPQQIIQLISCGPLPSGYARSTYTIPAQMDSEGNISLEKHSIKFSNKSISLVAYDKAYQLKKERLDLPGKFKLEKRGILRLELQCGRNWIAEEAAQHKCKTVREKIDHFSSHSRKYLCKYANKLYLSGVYYQSNLLCQKIQTADYISDKSKVRMLHFVNILGEYGDFNIAFQELSKSLSKKQLHSLAEHFTALNIAPIPLMENCKLKSITSIPTLLNEMGDGTFEKKLNKKKKYIFPLGLNICME